MEGKFYSELTKQNYYSEEAKLAEEKAYTDQLQEKEKREQALKETREARAKEYNEALENLLKLHNELRVKHAEKVKELDKELKAYDCELAAQYKEQADKTNQIIQKFEEDYPRGFNLSVRFHSPTSAIEQFFCNFMKNFDLF